jgi:hypothetical protein
MKMLVESGWTQDAKNPNCFYKNGKALYFYPIAKRVVFWPDVRVLTHFIDRTLPISDADLLALIAIE